ncbi:hypothetical protein CPB83DRAFT_842530 [Crepidotus variabilis]|uniref:Uncharacterized protein n=1 Tax=Crepidotus variabilis TaxID=179855 RepID=A0A9P6ETK0_9AGAR|nr:hypothetical protein CPB83DRAFT_842530 [Crepidotus variabilis]
MPGVDGNGPNYISAHSADVILSDIRPIKLKPEALSAINVLLDEFLHSILSTSRSLATEKLRSALLSILPTSLGKEALLEAEVELRAYWERTKSKVPPEDDTRVFHLQWSFEVLRLKCSAYSTLNEEDEDPAAEFRIDEVFSKAHEYPPNTALLDPAALYLTAIIESMCEHILSNVGRVAARDSSRTYATVNDLFVALCEDDSVYGLFKTMKVYEQIETMTKTATSNTRRSKSISRNERSSLSRTSSGQQDLTLVNTSSISRRSSDGQSTIMSPSILGSRSSLDKGRIKDVQKTHRKSDSLRSDVSKLIDEDPPEEAAMLREFDDLMRSTSTMKVSLTPDRLKTMETYKQEKDQKTRHPDSHFPSISSPDIVPPSARRTPIRQVESINEEEEHKPKGRSRQASVTTPPVSSFQGVQPSRTRSISTTSTSHFTVTRKPVRSPSVSVTSTQPPPQMPAARIANTPSANPEKNGFPNRTRNKGRNRESLDLDDIMNGSDDEQIVHVTKKSTPVPSPKSAPTPRRGVNPPKVSASTRELMDFLAEGPPDAPQTLSKSGRELVDFLSQGPPDYGTNHGSQISLDKSQKSGSRLQRMMSKLSIVSPEKQRTNGDLKSPVRLTHTPVLSLHSKVSSGTLSSLANRPIPPRPPRPPSPPSSHDSLEDRSPGLVPQSTVVRRVQEPPSREPSGGAEQPMRVQPTPIISSPPSSLRDSPHSPDRDQSSTSHRTPPSAYAHSPSHIKGVTKPVSPIRTPSHPSGSTRKIVPELTSTPITTHNPPLAAAAPKLANPTALTPCISEADVHDMQRLLSSATTADECRLIFNMFVARSGVYEPSKEENPYPSPTPSIAKPEPPLDSEVTVETALVELLLGNSTAPSTIIGSASQSSPAQGLVKVDQAPVSPADSMPRKLPQSPQNTHIPSHRHHVSPVANQPLVPIRA